ncbi:MAG: hypothetical protein JXJ04_19855 [Spirochaetales bacterium]|nr:hypothetical protein [Spirochaetales bacterium]
MRKSDGTCPQCLNDMKHPDPAKIAEYNKKLHKVEKVAGPKVDSREEQKRDISVYFWQKVIPFLFVFIAGLGYAFIKKNIIVGIVDIFIGIIYFSFNLITYFSKKASLKLETSLEKENKNNRF